MEALDLRRGSPRTCFLHVGTHKTGTTSIQSVLGMSGPSVAASGLYVPRAGRPSPAAGHHNLAWELNDDERFDPALGTLADVCAEIARSGSRRACLSSEDFEYLHIRPARLRMLAAALEAIGYQPVPIVYLRPQAGYAESLYAELVKHGLALSFDSFLDAIVATGEFRFRERWCFTFDYERLIDDFAAVFGTANTIVRSYDAGRGGVTTDFLRVVGAGTEARALAVHPRLNSALRFADVLRRLDYNSGDENATSAADRYRLNGPFDPVNLTDVRRIVERFNAGNRRVYERYGARVPCVSGGDLCADIAAAVGIAPGSRRRQRIAAADSTRPDRPRPPAAPALVQLGALVDAAGFALAARLEVVVGATAAFAAFAAIVFGQQTNCTALVEFGALSAIAAASAAAAVARYAVEAAGIIADYRFFDDWCARLSMSAYALVGFYAFANAVLDVGVPRFEPDFASAPGTCTAALVTVVLAAILAVKRYYGAQLAAAPRIARATDERAYVICGGGVLLTQAGHAVTSAWWLDTSIDALVVALAVVMISRLQRVARRALRYVPADWYDGSTR